MNADEDCRLRGIRSDGALLRAELDISVSQQANQDVPCLQLGAKAPCESQGDIFFVAGCAEARSQIRAAMSRVNHHQERLCRGIWLLRAESRHHDEANAQKYSEAHRQQ